VLTGKAGPALLDSYDAERRFVAERTLGQALARLAAWFRDPGKRLPPPEPIVDDRAVVLGARYPRGALVGEPGAPVESDAFEDPGHPSGRPGTRAPHLVVERDGRRRSIHDEIGTGFLLLAGLRGARWCDAAAAIRERTGLAIGSLAIGGDVESRFTQRYGVGPAGAVLVRPDGYIAWRSVDDVAAPEAALRVALGRILDRVIR
jgi:putative polyketide hydroxylase